MTDLHCDGECDGRLEVDESCSLHGDPHYLKLTDAELSALRACVSGELDNDEGTGEQYMRALRSVSRKLYKRSQSVQDRYTE